MPAHATQANTQHTTKLMKGPLKKELGPDFVGSIHCMCAAIASIAPGSNLGYEWRSLQEYRHYLAMGAVAAKEWRHQQDAAAE